MYQIILSIGFMLTLSILLFALGHAKLHRLRTTVVLPAEQFSRLMQLAERSLETADVPVGALLLYKGDIIGEGYNTVLRNAQAGEHAEINAISGAIRNLGMEAFTKLERKSLMLATTFEPCLMCAGAFINYNIQNVFFMKEKDFSYTSTENALLVRYLLHRRQILSGNEQVALFEKHPAYPHMKEKQKFS